MSRTLASASWLALLVALAATGLGAAAPAAPPAAPPAQQSQLVERAEVRLVQVDISVLDPKESSYRSVPGLTLEQFELRLDGKPLTADT